MSSNTARPLYIRRPAGFENTGKSSKWEGVAQFDPIGYLSFLDSDNKRILLKDYKGFTKRITGTYDLKGLTNISNAFLSSRRVGFPSERCHWAQNTLIEHIVNNDEFDYNKYRIDEMPTQKFTIEEEQITCDVRTIHQPRFSDADYDNKRQLIQEMHKDRTLDEFSKITVIIDPPENRQSIINCKYWSAKLSHEDPSLATGLQVNSDNFPDQRFVARTLIPSAKDPKDNFTARLDLDGTELKDASDTESMKQLKRLYNYPDGLQLEMEALMYITPHPEDSRYYNSGRGASETQGNEGTINYNVDDYDESDEDHTAETARGDSNTELEDRVQHLPRGMSGLSVGSNLPAPSSSRKAIVQKAMDIATGSSSTGRRTGSSKTKPRDSSAAGSWVRRRPKK